MIKVECPGCKAPYQVDERRVPDAGLKMRCPKCATSFVVTKPGAPAAAKPAAKPPADVVATKPATGVAPAAKPPAAAPKGADVLAGADWDLPAPSGDRASRGAPPPAKRPAPAAPAPAASDDDDIDLPIVARGTAPVRPPVPVKTAQAPALRAPDPPAKGGSFGEIDLMVDLPSPGGAGGGDDEIDLPIARDSRASAPKGAPPAKPTKGAPPPADAVRARTQLFGDTVPDPSATPTADVKAAPIRVPVPAREPKAAKPAAAPPPARPAAPPKAPPKAPPPLMDDGLGFGEIDLPLLAHEADLPSFTGGAGLPSPAAAGLPSPGGAGLPMTASAGLPTPVDGAGLPTKQQAGLPVAFAGTTLPVAAEGTTLPARGRVSTPLTGTPPVVDPPPAKPAVSDRHSRPTVRDVDGPKVHGPGHIAGADIYSGAVYDDRHMDPAFRAEARSVVTKLPTEDPDEAPLMTTQGQTLGASAPAERPSPRAATMPEPRIAAAPERLTRGNPMADLIDRTSIELDLIEPGGPPAAPTPPPAIHMPAADPFGHEQPLSVPDLSATPDGTLPPVHRFDDDAWSEPASDDAFTRNDEINDAGTEAPIGAPDVGDELDLDGKSGSRQVGGSKIPQTGGSTSTTDAPPPGRPWKKILVGAAAAGLLVGAGLSFVPDIGPFGLNFVSDRVNKGLHNDALDTSRGLVQGDLEADTSAGADLAIAKVKTAQRAYPRHRATAGYSAFVSYLRVIRFGPRAEDKAYADMMLRASQDKSTDFLLLGQAAQDALSGQIARARQTMQGLLERRPDDIDVAVLAGEVELLAKSGDQAKKVWQRAVDIKKIPRTLFGLARAQVAAGDLIGAEASATKTLEMSAKHVGARTLLAGIVWQNGGREEKALELLGKVTEDQEIRSTAGEPELVAAYTQLGHIHLAKSRMSQAEQAFAAALKIDPQAVNALVGNGELFYRSGRYSEAVARYEAAIRADADSVPAKIGMAKTQLYLERAKDAKDLLKKLCETRPNEPLAFYWLGRAEETLGNKKEAEAAYTNAIKVGGDSPQTVEAYVALAQLLSSLGRTEDATQRLTEAGNRFPGLAALHRARGEVALMTGNYTEAKKELELALAREDDIGAKFKLGSVLRRMRSYDEAARIFDAIAETDKEFPGLALERGLLFEETGQSDRASEMYAKALQSAPNDLDLKLRVGSTQVMAGHAKQAEPILREVHKAKPNSAEVNHFLGRALLVRGTSLAEAKRFLERAAEIDPNRAEYHLYVGWVANELGETQLAESSLQRAIELDRNLGDAYWQRGVLLQKQGQALDALNDLKIALEKAPSRFEIYATMAFCYQDQSRWPEAEDAWRRAIAGNDNVADWHYRLGKVYVTRGNKGLAAPELAKAVELAEAPDKPTPGWLAEAHFLLGEAFRATDRVKAKRHYQRFLELAPQNHAYRVDAERALASISSAP
ncbi:MAG: zinc-ribbon domain-containing protein [Polyangiaceae bacterium]|nr:zinc-ribbon domain-containing protein [Polyangiaceae bacterium]